MTCSDYLDAWEQDAKIDPAELDTAAREVPLLHAKYWRWYVAERLRYKKLDYEYKALYQLRYEYWWGRLDDEVRKAHGWPVQPLKILAPQLSIYLDGDIILQDAAKKRLVVEETLRFLEDVIKSINNRNFTISNMIKYLAFKMGG